MGMKARGKVFHGKFVRMSVVINGEKIVIGPYTPEDINSFFDPSNYLNNENRQSKTVFREDKNP